MQYFRSPTGSITIQTKITMPLITAPIVIISDVSGSWWLLHVQKLIGQNPRQEK